MEPSVCVCVWVRVRKRRGRLPLMDEALWHFLVHKTFVCMIIKFWFVNFKKTSFLNQIMYLWSVFTIRPARNLTRFGFDRADRSVSLMSPRIRVAQMAGAAVRRRPKRLRRLLSRARQVLASDRCGISVMPERCQRAGLMRREEMIWLSQAQARLCTRAPAARRGKKTERRESTPVGSRRRVVHLGHHEAIFTSWLLPKIIRSPSVASTLALSMSSPPGPTAALHQRNVNESERHPALMNEIRTSRQSLFYEIKIEHWPSTISHFHRPPHGPWYWVTRA